jgi:hypothetical protein
MQTFQNFLANPPAAPNQTASELTVTQTTLTNYIYEFNSSDRSYDTSQYSTSGVFDKTTTPWLNDLLTVPADWRPNTVDRDYSTTRGQQVDSENSYIQANVPGQQYTGTVDEQIQQRFSKGLFDNSVFPQDQVDILTENWINDDLEFARQRLGAANPNVIAKYAGTDSDLTDLVNNSAGAINKTELITTLTTANANGTLFVCDYSSALNGIAKNDYVQTNFKPDYMPDGFFFSVPIAFFVADTSDGSEVLKPVAIQIDAINDAYFFTPQDSANAWLLAKLWTASADAQWWFSGTHLFNTHSIDMLFGISALNLIEQGLLDENHPIVVLMSPHLKKVFDVNTAVYDASDATVGIYQKGSFCDGFLPTGRIGIYQLINDLYQNYSFDDMAFDKTIAARNMQSQDFSGSFPYRDDGEIWWKTISNFVANIVDATYASDTEVADDKQLNQWMQLTESAFNQDGTTRFTWIATISYLKQMMSNLFFLATVQHTSVNNSMLPGWAFVPNGSFAMTSAPPTDGNVDDQALLDSLPDPQFKTSDGQYAWLILNQIDFVMNGTSGVSEVVAGNGNVDDLYAMYPYSSGTAQYDAVTSFYNSLWVGDNSVKSQVTANQQARISSYVAANPTATTVPNSVSYYYQSVELVSDMNLNAATMNCIQI